MFSQRDAEFLSACGGAFIRQVNFLTQSRLLTTKSGSSVLCQLLNTGMVTPVAFALGNAESAQARLLEITLRHTLTAVLSL